MKLRNPFKGFTTFEWCLWIGSMAAIIISHFAVLSNDWLSLITSIIGVTCLIFAARGDPLAPIITVAFSSMYVVVSYFFGYYGEMMIYLGMQIPIALASIFTWLKNRNPKNGAQVKTGRFTYKKLLIMLALDAAITTAFYFILDYFDTPNLIPSTLSVTTSFAALFFMALRIPQYALFFILNDVVMIVLWGLALSQDIGYVSLVVCFTVFLANDAYTFISWLKRSKEAQ